MEEPKKKINITKKTKIIAIIIAIIIIAGIAVTATIGLNYDLRYQSAQKIELYIEKDFNNSDIKNIVNEVMPNIPVIIQKVEVFEDTVSITAKEITDEQKQNIISKVNEKYGTNLSADSTEIESISNTRGRDLVKPYIFGFVMSILIILIYIAVRYMNLGVLKTLGQIILTLVLTQAVLLSVIAITRIPVGRLTMPIVVAVYLLTLIGLTTKFEKDLATKKQEKKKK